MVTPLQYVCSRQFVFHTGILSISATHLPCAVRSSSRTLYSDVTPISISAAWTVNIGTEGIIALVCKIVNDLLGVVFFACTCSQFIVAVVVWK